MNFLKRTGIYFLKILKVITFFFGIVSVIMLGLSFTDQPYWAYHWLGTANSEIENRPDYIVVMGAGGMPGGTGLMRCNFAASAAKSFKNAKIIVAMPALSTGFLQSDAFKMYQEISHYNIDQGRFIFETKGTNTHSQAVEVFEMLKNKPAKNILVVTSPVHMYRCILTFEQCGFQNVDGFPAFQAPMDDNLLFTEEERLKKVAPIHRNISFRYNLWNYLRLEIDVLHEGTALVYYKIKGYI